MIRVLIFFAVVVLAALGFVWLADHPGSVTIAFGGREVQFSTLVAIAFLLVAAVVVAVGWTLLRFLFRIPSLVSLASRSRKRQRGFLALSRGMIAVGSGDGEAARRYSVEAARLLEREPLALLLQAQTAQLGGDRKTAEKAFSDMLADPETRGLGLRGLHIEAQRRGDAPAAYAFAEEALKTSTLPWAGAAVLQERARRRDWVGALRAVERNAAGRTVERETTNRQRAVLNAAIARDVADRDLEAALAHAREALKWAPTLVPAAALAGRLLARKGDIRRAAKLIEGAFAATPHPELAAAYVDLRPGDAAADRLRRAETLARLAPNDPESRMAVARTALEAREFALARATLLPLSEGDRDRPRPTAKVCLLMADIEEAEHGETGALFEWLQRASRAPRDPAWVADGIVADTWAPASPVTGRLDAFVWARPADQLSPALDLPAVRRAQPAEASPAAGREGAPALAPAGEASPALDVPA